MKKTIPLHILQTIATVLDKIDNKVVLVDKGTESIFRVVDADPNSDFYFEITKYEPGSEDLLVHIERKPENNISVDEKRETVYVRNFASKFNSWLTVVKEYGNVKSHLDDPILEQYEEEFFAEFEMAEEDADEVSFSFKKQLLIDNGLEMLVAKLEQEKEVASPEKQKLIGAIIEEVEEIRETLTESTKTEIITKISNVYAKIRKFSMKLIKETYPILQKEIITQAVKGAFELGSNLNVGSIIDAVQ